MSFLSRMLGSSKKKGDGDEDPEDDVARTDGMDAHVFSQPIGYMPTFPAPPKYIRVCWRFLPSRVCWLIGPRSIQDINHAETLIKCFSRKNYIESCQMVSSPRRQDQSPWWILTLQAQRCQNTSPERSGQCALVKMADILPPRDKT